MLPMKALRLALGESLAANATYLAPAALENKIMLVKAAFTPDELLVFADLTAADFDGSTPIDGAVGTQQVGLDPTTGQQIITIIPPLGGYHWEVTGVTNLPQTIFGFALVNEAMTILLAVELFATPLSLNEVGDQVTLDPVTLTLVQQPMS